MRPLLDRVDDVAGFFAVDADEEAERALIRGETTGRPLGTPAWVAALEARVGRPLAPRKRGRKPGPAPEQTAVML